MNAPTLTILNDQSIQGIHDVSLEILSTIGVRIPHPQMRQLFRGAGAEVEDSTEIVKIPECLVWQCLDSAHKKFSIYGRDRARQARFGQSDRNYVATAGQALWVDDASSRRRYATMDDVVTGARLGNALPLLNIVGGMADPHAH